MRFTLLALTLLLVGCGAGSGDDAATWARVYRDNEWLVTERVVFAGTHDSSVIELQDGVRLDVLYPDQATWEAVRAWPKGTPLVFAYATAHGCLLIESQSGIRLVVYDGFGARHPLDLVLHRGFSIGGTSNDRNENYDSNVMRWLTEIDRIHRFLDGQRTLTPEARAALRAEHAAWRSFIEAHGRASSLVYAVPNGTLWRDKSIEAHHAMIREHALRLLMLIEPISAATIEAW
jgi:hypothetical protein